MKEKILIVEDQSVEALNLERILLNAGYIVCGVAKSVERALEIIAKQKPDLVLLDIFLKGSLTGIDLGHQLREQGIAFIYLSANSNRATLDAAKITCPGGFLVKPARERDVVAMLEIARYKNKHGLETMVKIAGEIALSGNEIKPTGPTLASKTTAKKPASNLSGIIGKSPKLKEVLYHLQIVAPTDTGVLILGESGTGKEKIAEAVHDLSGRSGPFIKVNCAALPVNLIESMLFGHEKGAFTGAMERSIGKFEQAQHGTIFLDEIGEIPPEVQVKLLRALQENEIERLGGKTTIKLDVRIIAATNRNLEKEVAEGRFRMDLYYRLNVFPLHLPALRDRKEDIPLLATHFLDHYCSKLSKPPMSVSQTLLNELMQYNWPGNIRELQHVIERTVLLTTGETIQKIYLTGSNINTATTSSIDPLQIKTIDEQEKEYILKILKLCNGKVAGKDGAAALLKIPPSTLDSKMKRLGIKKEHFG